MRNAVEYSSRCIYRHLYVCVGCLCLVCWGGVACACVRACVRVSNSASSRVFTSLDITLRVPAGRTFTTTLLLLLLVPPRVDDPIYEILRSPEHNDDERQVKERTKHPKRRARGPTRPRPGPSWRRRRALVPLPGALEPVLCENLEVVLHARSHAGISGLVHDICQFGAERVHVQILVVHFEALHIQPQAIST
jgi:hypothetical protein